MRKIKILKLLIFTAAVCGLGVFGFFAPVQAAAPKCSDGINNDPTEDGLIDFLNDPDCISAFDQSENSGHPFLLVTEDMYPEMRKRYADGLQPRWKQMGDEAIANCKNLNHESDYNTAPLSNSVHIYYGKGAPLQRRMNGCALAYILDPGNKAIYLAQYKQGMSNWADLKIIAEEIAGNDGDSYIIVGSAYIMSMLATDIFYNDLSISNPSLLATYENQYLTRTMGELLSKKNHNRGTKMVWAIYNHHRSPTAENKQIVDDYRQLYLDTFFRDKFNSTGETKEVSADGAYAAGSAYAFERNIARGHRVSKFGEMDIATFTGYDDYFQDERFEKLYQWDFHFAATPSRRNYLTSFGDTQLTENWASYLPKAARLYTLNRWSADLAGHAAWLIDGLIDGSEKTTWGESSLFAYVNDAPLPAPIKPTSRIFSNGGAAFWENSPSDNSLMGAIQSMDISEWHTRNEANSIYIQGYGEHLITNPGSVSYSNKVAEGCRTPELFGDLTLERPGYYMPNTKFNSHVANTVAINWDAGKHVIKAGYNWPDAGKGISEGFVNSFFDYSSADSGLALPNGHHQRNFLFVHPENGKNYGYYVLFDEVATTSNLSTNTTAQVYLHPLSDALMQSTSTSQNLEYKARTQLPDLVSNNETNATISIFLGTPPAADIGATIKENNANGVVFVGKSAPTNPDAFCRYVDFLRTNYDLDLVGNTRKKNIVTILFPSDRTHDKAPMSRITGTNFTGAEIAHSTAIKDYAIESSSANSINHYGVSFQGLASMYRINNDENEFYFVRQGKEFNDGKPNKKGFTSNNPVSVYLQNKSGKIIVPTGGATVTFFYPGITGIKIDGVAQQNNINISAGNHEVEILTGPILNPADVNSDGKVNIKDIQICIKAITSSSSITAEQLQRCKELAPPDTVANIKDIQAIIQEIIKS